MQFACRVTHQFPSVYWPSATTVNGLEHPVKSAIICKLAWEYAAANVAPAPDAYPVTDAMAGTALANDREATKRRSRQDPPDSP